MRPVYVITFEKDNTLYYFDKIEGNVVKFTRKRSMAYTYIDVNKAVNFIKKLCPEEIKNQYKIQVRALTPINIGGKI